jgi:hypothetical protein
MKSLQAPPAPISSLLRRIATLITLAICTLTFAATSVGIFASLLGKDSAGSRDFIQYWAAGRQLIHHANPYDESAILPMEVAAGYPSNLKAFIMPNPPTALPLVVPLGLFGPRIAEMLWLALSLAALIASVQMIRAMHGSPKNHLHWLGYAFAPALSCLLSGQITIFVMFGLALFLWLHNRSSLFLSGMALWFCLLKPHLFLPFGVALLAWIILTGSYKVLAGAASSILLSGAVALLLDPSAWAEYAEIMASRRPDLLSIPCLSVLLRQHVGHTHWLQYLPAAAGCAWAIVYFRKHRAEWNWLHHGSMLMLVSILVAPYTWFMDQVILIPAVLHGAYATRSRGSIAVLALASAIIEIQILRGVPLLKSSFYLWTSPAWLAWYLWATKAQPIPGKTVPPPADGLLQRSESLGAAR